MASKDENDDINNISEQKKTIKTKHRHKFSKEELQELLKIFTLTPYPDFTRREELAERFNCPVHVINTWFQNNRARKSPEEKQRIYAVWKQQNYLVQDHPPLSNQAEAPSYTTEQSFFGEQNVLTGIAGDSTLDKQKVTSKPMCSSCYSLWEQGLPTPQFCSNCSPPETQQIPYQQVGSSCSCLWGQGFFSPQVCPRCSSLKTQGLPYQQVDSNTSMVAGAGMQPGFPLEYGNDPESGPSNSSWMSFSSMPSSF